MKCITCIVITTCLIALFVFSCEKEHLPTAVNEKGDDDITDPLIKKIGEMGFRTDMIIDKGDYFRVEGDLVFHKDQLRNMLKPSQYHTDNLVSRENIKYITVNVDESMPSSGNDNWRIEIEKACNDWTNISECYIEFDYYAYGDRDITVYGVHDTEDDTWIGEAGFPSGGMPYDTIKINLDYLNNKNVPSAQKEEVIVHELGHCIGFRHTNWEEQDEDEEPWGANQIYGTSTDGNSVMNGGQAEEQWDGFSEWDIWAAQLLYWEKYISGGGSEGEGADLAFANIGGTSRPDVVMMVYDAPAGQNSFKYKIGWDVDTDGFASSWSNIKTTSGLGYYGDGAGIAIHNIDGDSDPDMVFMVYDDPSGQNQFKYKIGWDLNSSGNPSSWSESKSTSGLGYYGDGAGVAIFNIDHDSYPDMVFMVYDAPSGTNQFKYKIGWDLNSSGDASSWSGSKSTSGFGYYGDGAGIAIADIGEDPEPDMVLMAYDDPSGSNSFKYKIGWDLSSSGDAASWSSTYTVTGVGDYGGGAGAFLYNLVGSSPLDLIFMAYDDNPSSLCRFKYRIGKDLNSGGTTSYWY
jgi:hypothetical protein